MNPVDPTPALGRQDPGHSFVLIDKAGKQRWYGEYPSMFLSTADLLKEINAHLSS